MLWVSSNSYLNPQHKLSYIVGSFKGEISQLSQINCHLQNFSDVQYEIFCILPITLLHTKFIMIQ